MLSLPLLLIIFAAVIIGLSASFPWLAAITIFIISVITLLTALTWVKKGNELIVVTAALWLFFMWLATFGAWLFNWEFLIK